MSFIRDILTISWASPKCLGHFSCSALSNIHSLSSRLWPALLCSVLGSESMVLHLQNACLLQLGCSFTSSLSWALMVSTSLNFSSLPCNPGASITAEAAASSMTFPDLPEYQLPNIHSDPFLPSKQIAPG